MTNKLSEDEQKIINRSRDAAGKLSEELGKLMSSTNPLMQALGSELLEQTKLTESRLDRVKVIACDSE